MPIFDYSCNCGNVELDQLVKESEEKVICPVCGEEMERALAAPNLVGFDSYGTSGKAKS